jgi:small redox-active disulfide protein 2
LVDVTQLTIGGIKVGLIGLDRVLAQVAAECLGSDAEIADRLLALIRDANYVTPSRTEDYRRALLREFKRRRGEAVPAEPGELEIRVLGTGCPNCHRLMSEVMAVLTELEIAADLEHVRDLKKIAEFGPVLTPTLVINGKVVSSGRVPRREDIVRYLKEASK